MHTFDDRFPHSDQSAQHAAHQRAYLDPNVSEPPRIMQKRLRFSLFKDQTNFSFGCVTEGLIFL